MYDWHHVIWTCVSITNINSIKLRYWHMTSLPIHDTCAFCGHVPHVVFYTCICMCNVCEHSTCYASVSLCTLCILTDLLVSLWLKLLLTPFVISFLCLLPYHFSLLWFHGSIATISSSNILFGIPRQEQISLWTNESCFYDKIITNVMKMSWK